MGYRITYNLRPPKKGENRGVDFRAMVAGCFLLFVLFVRLWWPEARTLLERFLLPSEMGDTQSVLVEIAEEIRNGDSFSEVVGAFCRESVEDAHSD